MARTSAVGYVAAQKQGASGAAGVVNTISNMASPRFFRFLSAPKGSAELTNNRYREGGGGRDITLSLKEGIKHMIEFPHFARPAAIGYVLAAACGTGAAGIAGGGQSSNGLVRPPLLKAASTKTSTVGAATAAGATTITLATGGGALFTAGGSDKVCIGWGPNLEFLTTTSVAGDVITVPALIFPHVKGEPIYEVKGYGTIASGAPGIGGTTFTLAASHGLVTGDAPFALAGNSLVPGSEIGNAEEFATATITVNAVSAVTTRNGHSVGAWFYQVDNTITTSRIHGFEPISSLTGTLDYYTVERTATGSTAIIERVQDCKVGTLELTGESPGPVKIQNSWVGRFAQVQTSALTESYTNQSSTDLPFRMVNGKYCIAFGSSIGLSTKLKGFTWNFSNTMDPSIYTDSITSDDILDLARESTFTAQFYFESPAEYYQVYYGSAAPTLGSTPTTSQTTGALMMDFTIDATHRMSIYMPNVVWEGFPVEVDPEPKAIVVEATGTPTKLGSQPLSAICVQNADTTLY